MQIQTHGLLADIKSRTWLTGDAVIAWTELSSFMARFGQGDAQQAIKDWASDNMMWVEFHRDGGGEITSAVFGASK
jgi:hypothetical protein